MNQITIYLLIFIVIFSAGSIIIEIRRAANAKRGRPFVERRRTHKIDLLQPLGNDVLDEAMQLIDENKLRTRDGMRFITKIMQEIHSADVQRTLKINEIVEQFETLRNKSLMIFSEKYPKLSLLIILLIFAWITDEIRAPVIRALFSTWNINLP
jgi:hypothetical protein